MAENKEKGLTRAQKTAATKTIIKELLAGKLMRHNELIDEAAKEYIARHGNEDGENANDVRGRVGSVLDVMKKESQVMVDDGVYALKARMMLPRATKTEEEPAATPKKRTRAKKEEKPVEEAPAEKESSEPSPPKEEKATPKKRGRKPKAKVEPEEKEVVKEEVQEEVQEVVKEEVQEEIKEEVQEEAKETVEPEREKKAELIVKPKAEVAQKGVVMDMSFLFGDKPQRPARNASPVVEKKEERAEKKEIKPAAKPKEEKPAVAGKAEKKPTKPKAASKPLTAEERLKEEFLQRMRTLGGDYFEYYSVYLLERYSMKNGRRLEAMRVCGGDHDGGIDGEIELTDTLGFRETIYIQSKNWDPGKGRTNSWVVGETLLQQFLGACAYAQAKSGKQHCRGIFMTTSKFTPDAKVILDTMSDKIVGYDGDDLFEAAKECSFGVFKRNGEWVLDEQLLSGEKAFFQMR